ncbi:monooxygenase FAD-binding protein, partial [Actinobacteria bacterium OV320]
MTPDLDSLATALYVKTDDLLKESPCLAPWRAVVGIPPRLTDAELFTLAVTQALLGFTSERRWIRHAQAHLRHLFPYLPGHSGYNRRLRKATDLIAQVVNRLLATDTSLWTDTVWVVDSTPAEYGRSRETAKAIRPGRLGRTGEKADERQTLLDMLHAEPPLRQVIESVNQTFKAQLDLERHQGRTPGGWRVGGVWLGVWLCSSCEEPHNRYISARSHRCPVPDASTGLWEEGVVPVAGGRGLRVGQGCLFLLSVLGYWRGEPTMTGVLGVSGVVETDVVVVGGGPVGLVVACELAVRGVRVVVLESEVVVSARPRATTVHARAVQCLVRRGYLGGLVEWGAGGGRLLDGDRTGVPGPGCGEGAGLSGDAVGMPEGAGVPGPGLGGSGVGGGVGFHFGGLGGLVVSAPGLEPVAVLKCAQEELESHFEVRARGLGVRVLRGCRVVGVRQWRGGVVVTARGAFGSVV